MSTALCVIDTFVASAQRKTHPRCGAQKDAGARIGAPGPVKDG